MSDELNPALPQKSLVLQELEVMEKFLRETPEHEIRDFRGVLQGRADKGLFATTGSFTRDAIKEASRDGATPIDLLDGEALVNKIKELKLGISIDYVEEVNIDKKWFESI